MKIVNNILFLVVLLVSVSAYSQRNRYCLYDQVALDYYQKGDLEKAVAYIDTAINNCPDFAEDYQVYHYKGFFLKELYKKHENGALNSAYRDQAIAALLKSNELDANQEVVVKNKRLIKSMAVSIHNSIVGNMDTVNFEKAILLNKEYLKVMSLIGEDAFKSEWEKEFLTVLGDVYEAKYENNKKDDTYYDLAIRTYENLIVLDSNSFKGYKSIGIIYHNRAVKMMGELDDEADIFTLDFLDFQDRIVAVGEKALPYLKKSYELNPEDKTVVYALASVYAMMFDKEKEGYYVKVYGELTNGESLYED